MTYIHNEKPLVASKQRKGYEQGRMALQPRN